MTEQIRNQISTFIDNELSVEESELLIRRVSSSGELKSVVARYSLIGDVIGGSVAVPVPERFADSVMRQIENDTAPAEESTGRFWRVLQPVVGAAIAASVALGAIVLLQQTPGTQEIADAPRSYTTPGADSIDAGMPYELRMQLNEKLIRHSRYSGPGAQRRAMINLLHEQEPDSAAEQAESTEPLEQETE
ncbi:MAG: sigma-E factor negative regulatory protein [Gammaproteobacteria bacterium]